MSQLKARIDALKRQSGQDAETDAGRGAVDELSRRLERLRCGMESPVPAAVRPDPGRLAEQVGGELHADGYVTVETLRPAGTPHGDRQVGCGDDTTRHLPGAEGRPTADWVFVDTETSGLAGGTGTVPFLVGIARHEPAGLRVRQFLLGRFGAERAMLAACLESLGEAPRLVSYNGKSFDLPLLRDRLRLQRVGAGLERPVHLDLLHPVRRAFGALWEDCRLATLEQRLLRFRRHDDLPGAEVPAVWFAYLHQGRTERMADVLAHNREDLVSLAVALPALDAVYGDPSGAGADVRRIAACHQRAGRGDRALALLEAAEPDLSDAGRLELAELLRRKGCWDRACAIWQEQADRGCMHSVERLAKYHEHIRRDWQRALVFAGRLPAGGDRDRRVERLRAKLGTQAPLSLSC